MKPKTVYVLCWSMKDDASCWDTWGVYTDYGMACFLEEKLQWDYQDRYFNIYSETLNEEVYEAI